MPGRAHSEESTLWPAGREVTTMSASATASATESTGCTGSDSCWYMRVANAAAFVKSAS